MYRIRKIENSDSDFAKAAHSENIFHDAQNSGEKHLMVSGALYGDYVLEYMRNDEIIPEQMRKMKKVDHIYPDYEKYNENDLDTLDLSLLNDHKAILYDTLDEYTVVTARLALQHTDMRLYFKNSMIKNFLPESDRIVITDQFPEGSEDDNSYLKIVDQFVTGAFQGHYHRLCPITLFHSIFYKQSFTDVPLKDIRYVEVSIAPNVGIGGILSYYYDMKQFFSSYGWDVFLKENCTRYPNTLLEKYFGFSAIPADSSHENTVYIGEVITIVDLYACSENLVEIDDNILNDNFRKDMEEYTQALLAGHNSLGVLIRGTDYIVSNMSGTRKMATPEEMIPMIKDWIREDGYNRIVLATEDADILDTMRNEFGSMLITIAQVRHRVSDFVDVSLISDLEKEENSPDQYEEILEDNTVNYFYALYVLSRCNSFMCSGQCHGWTVVNAFNHGKFKRSYKFSTGVKK